ADDVRYFAFEVQPAWPVLLVAPSNVSTRYLSEALAPLELRESGRASFRCDTIEQGRLASQDLDNYRAIALVDPAPLTADVWKKLADYCEAGGGVHFSRQPRSADRVVSRSRRNESPRRQAHASSTDRWRYLSGPAHL